MSSKVQGITVLGSTGSIGVSTLDVIKRNSSRYQVIALTAFSQVERLFQQCVDFQPRYAVMLDENAAEKLQNKLSKVGLSTEVKCGVNELDFVASLSSVDYVMAAIVGAAGLQSTLAAARASKKILLANKESLVMSGKIFIDEVSKYSAQLLPIDSEHNAIFQCMPDDFSRGFQNGGVRKILLTASGGPFRETPVNELSTKTPDQACAHPNWVMGRKISVDSATMMNKGLEVIEAHWLFNANSAQIEVVLHPQSVIHSMVQYQDGTVLAQLGNPDMRTPIANALAWPERIDSGVDDLNIIDIARLDFEKPDENRFPCLRLARNALEADGTACTILNAANEIAVQAFLDLRIGFLDIHKTVEKVLTEVSCKNANTLENILDSDRAARVATESFINTSIKQAS